MKSRLCRGPQVRRIPELYMGSVQFELSVCADGHIDGHAYKPVVPDVCLGQTPSKTEYFPARVSPYAACVPHAQSALRASSVPSFECAVLLSQSDRKLRSRKEAAEKVLRHVSEKLHQVQHTIAPPRTQTNPNQLRARPRMCLLLATRQITQEQAPRSKHARLPAIFHFGIEVGPALALAAALAARVCNVAPLERAVAGAIRAAFCVLFFPQSRRIRWAWSTGIRS